MEYALILVAAAALDAAFGEPGWLWSRAPHPRVTLIRFCTRLRDLLRGRFEQRIPGGIAVGLLAVAAGVAGWAIGSVPYFGIVEAAIAAILIGFRDVLDRLGAVEHALPAGTDFGADALARIARRRVEETTEDMTARLAMEYSARHFVDRFVAPVFWFLPFGLAGLAIVYAVDVARQVLAEDEAEADGFGWAARRLDELIKWIPGRIGGWILVLAALPRNAWDVMMDDNALHRSAYAGWPVAAAAGALDVALGGPRPGEAPGAAPYINRNGRREATAADLGALAGLLWRGWMVTVALLALLALPWLLF